MESSPLDAVDRSILYHLQQNARKSITDIADAVDVSDNTVRNRMQALEEEGIIKGYGVHVDFDKAGIQHHYVFVCSARVKRREQLANKVRELSGVTEVITLMTGNHNVFVIGAGNEKTDMTDLAYEIDDMGLAIEREHLIHTQEHEPFDGFRLENNL